MTPDAIAAYTALAVAVISAVTGLYRGWRKRLQDAARQPFLIGTAAIEEAQTALRLKDDRIAELTRSEGSLKSQLAAATGAADAQQEQIVQLQSRLYQTEAQNRDLKIRAENSERREQEALTRISDLERDISDLKRKLALHDPPGF